MGQSMCRAALTICPNQPPSLLLFLTCRPAAAAAAPRYLPWDAGNKDGPSFASDVLVVDCTHGAAQTITHHKGQRNPPAELLSSDCSTGLVLDALKAAEGGGRAAVAIAPWLVSCWLHGQAPRWGKLWLAAVLPSACAAGMPCLLQPGSGSSLALSKLHVSPATPRCLAGQAVRVGEPL